uniref:Uncharacterized protein n=1 Tax=Ascaris lumbricoides TaxID=6252 RepID=A0A0M3IB63_ASCLU
MFRISRSYTSSLVRLCNRAICGTGQPVPRFYHQSPFRKFLEYFTEGEEERFSISGVSRSHAWDRLDARHWMLIYRDANASRAYALVAVLFPTAMIAVAILLLDFLHNEPNNRTSFVQKLCKDAAEMPFDRSLAVLLGDPHNDGFAQSLWRMFVSGTLLLNGRRVVHDDDCFRANNYRSFMLNQTNTPPRKFESKHRS